MDLNRALEGGAMSDGIWYAPALTAASTSDRLIVSGILIKGFSDNI